MEKSQPPTYAEFVGKLFNKSEDQSKNFGHCVLGVVTEIHEYLSATDEINGLEELGDMAFYAEALRQTVENSTGHPHVRANSTELLVHQASNMGPAVVISDLCNTLLDDAKRWIGYGKEPRSLDEVLDTCLDLIDMVNYTGPYPCLDADRVKYVNMKKLWKRYPTGEFNAVHAVERNVEAERVVLQTA